MHIDISIITPWLDHSEFIDDYERAVKAPGVEVIVVDNGSADQTAAALRAMVGRLGGRYLRNEENHWFAAANNQGLRIATGQIIVFLNNDIAGDPGWLDRVRQDVAPGSLVGPTVQKTRVEQTVITYLEGWCIAGRREVWNHIGGWDEQAFKMPYWEDAELSIRASRAGVRMGQAQWQLTHKKNGTSGFVPGILYGFEQNRQTLSARMRGETAAQTPAAPGPLEPLANYLQTGRLPEAERAYREAVTRQPNDARLWANYGQALRISGRFEAAIGAQHRAMQLEPPLAADAYREIALSYESMEKHADAVEAFKELVRLRPTSIGAQVLLATSLNMARMFAQAADVARAAIKQEPTNAPAQVQLSNALLRLGQTAAAQIAAQASLTADPNYPGGYHALGSAHHAAGAYVEALAAFDRSMALDPHNGMVNNERQQILAKLATAKPAS